MEKGDARQAVGAEVSTEAEVDPCQGAVPDVATQVLPAGSFSFVNRPTMGSAENWTTTETITPKPTAMAVAYHRVRRARRSFPAPIFWADRAETADSMEEGTRNTMPINFSTIPTAAASASPLRLAMIVMTIKAIWIKPS